MLPTSPNELHVLRVESTAMRTNLWKVRVSELICCPPLLLRGNVLLLLGDRKEIHGYGLAAGTSLVFFSGTMIIGDAGTSEPSCCFAGHWILEPSGALCAFRISASRIAASR